MKVWVRVGDSNGENIKKEERNSSSSRSRITAAGYWVAMVTQLLSLMPILAASPIALTSRDLHPPPISNIDIAIFAAHFGGTRLRGE